MKESYCVRPVTLGERIIAYRKEKVLSQTEMAKKLKTDDSTLSRIERDITWPNATRLSAIRELIGISDEEMRLYISARKPQPLPGFLVTAGDLRKIIPAVEGMGNGGVGVATILALIAEAHHQPPPQS